MNSVIDLNVPYSANNVQKAGNKPLTIHQVYAGQTTWGLEDSMDRTSGQSTTVGLKNESSTKPAPLPYKSLSSYPTPIVIRNITVPTLNTRTKTETPTTTGKAKRKSPAATKSQSQPLLRTSISTELQARPASMAASPFQPNKRMKSGFQSPSVSISSQIHMLSVAGSRPALDLQGSTTNVKHDIQVKPSYVAFPSQAVSVIQEQLPKGAMMQSAVPFKDRLPTGILYVMENTGQTGSGVWTGTVFNDCGLYSTYLDAKLACTAVMNSLSAHTLKQSPVHSAASKQEYLLDEIERMSKELINLVDYPPVGSGRLGQPSSRMLKEMVLSDTEILLRNLRQLVGDMELAHTGATQRNVHQPTAPKTLSQVPYISPGMVMMLPYCKDSSEISTASPPSQDMTRNGGLAHNRGLMESNGPGTMFPKLSCLDHLQLTFPRQYQ